MRTVLVGTIVGDVIFGLFNVGMPMTLSMVADSGHPLYCSFRTLPSLEYDRQRSDDIRARLIARNEKANEQAAEQED